MIFIKWRRPYKRASSLYYLRRRSLLFSLLRKLTSPPALAVILFLLSLAAMPVNKEELAESYPETYRLFDRNGKFLREAVGSSGVRGRFVSTPEISPFVMDAAVAVEDERFYSHPGIDFISIGRAFLQNIKERRIVSGASTLEMQLSRLVYNRSHSIGGKLLQAYDALRFTLAFSKDEILLHYLNRSPYGSGTVGIEAASQWYFNKPNKHLSLAEAALLSGLPQAPSSLHPVNNFEAAKRRQEHVLERMLSCGKIDRTMYEQAVREPINICPPGDEYTSLHFTDYILSRQPRPGNLYTTLDKDLNSQIEDLIRDHVAALQEGGMTNAACVVLDNSDGAILSMVGSTDYWNKGGGAVNGVLALRQPGSALKPFTYALAFEKGMSPATVIPDIKREYPGGYKPENYSKEFHGPVMLTEALGRSLNVPAIHLANLVGIDHLLLRLRLAGFTSLDKGIEHYGLTLTLGSGEVSLLELARAYAVFAREGLSCEVYGLEERAGESEEKRVFSKQVCFLITAILSDENLRMQAFGLANPLLVGFPMAIKTGTSSNWRDNWVIGYTGKYTIAVWAGDFDGAPMNQMSGSIGAGPLFNKIARLVVTRGSHPDIPVEAVPPEGVRRVLACKISGQAPTAYCKQSTSVYVLAGNEERPECTVHRLTGIDSRNGLLAGESCPRTYYEEKVFEYLPPVYASWLSDNGIEPPPSRFSPLCAPGKITAGALVIKKPRDNDIYLIEPGYDLNTQTLQLSGEVDPPVPDITWIIDGTEVAKVNWPYTASWKLAKGKHWVQMARGDKKSDKVVFEVK